MVGRVEELVKQELGRVEGLVKQELVLPPPVSNLSQMSARFS